MRYSRPKQIATLVLCACLFFPRCGYSEENTAEKAKPAAPAPDWRAIFQLHYTQRVDEFRHENELFQNVILVGDSITEGFDVQKYLPGRRVINRGIGADVIGNISEEHTSELQSQFHLVCRLLLEKKKTI